MTPSDLLARTPSGCTERSGVTRSNTLSTCEPFRDGTDNEVNRSASKLEQDQQLKGHKLVNVFLMLFFLTVQCLNFEFAHGYFGKSVGAES